MKRLPHFASLILFIALCASAAYWAMQFLQPPVRPIVAPPAAPQQTVELSAAAGLLGGAQASGSSNFQLSGVIIADHPRDSIAILAVDGKPARPYRLNSEIKPGVRLQEVQRGHVLLNQNGVQQRLELPAATKLPGAATSPAITPR